MAAPIRFGIVGFGNIGSGVVDIFTRNGPLINARLPRPLQLVRMADLDLTTKRPVPVPKGVEFIDDANRVLQGDDIDIVIELVGGLKPARQFVETALRAKKHVVTANKALLAHCGAELWNLAAENGVSLLCEAAVGGGIPCIRALQQGLAANEFTSVRGILNGTCNYILTAMAQTGAAYGDALADAKRLGYAEPDPTFDVEGFDTAHKIAILASLAFGQDIRFDDVHVEGISGVRADDLADAKENGLALKLVATAQRDDATSPVEVHVHPTLLPRGSGLGSVDGVINAVEFVGNAVGTVMLTGPGAGPAPTASAVLSDVMNLAQQIADGGLSLDSRLRVPVGVKSLCTFEDVETVHRVRARLTGDAAAPSQVRDAFAAEKVGVRELSESGHRVLTLITERAPEKRVQAVLKRLEALPCIAEAPASLRLEEKP